MGQSKEACGGSRKAAAHIHASHGRTHLFPRVPANTRKGNTGKGTHEFCSQPFFPLRWTTVGSCRAAGARNAPCRCELNHTAPVCASPSIAAPPSRPHPTHTKARRHRAALPHHSHSAAALTHATGPLEAAFCRQHTGVGNWRSVNSKAHGYDTGSVTERPRGFHHAPLLLLLLPPLSRTIPPTPQTATHPNRPTTTAPPPTCT